MNWANGRLLPPISRFRINVRDAVVIGSALGCIMAAVSAIDVVWVRPLPFPDASRLVRLSECRRGDLLPYETTWGNFRNWDPRQLMLARVGAYKPADPVLFTSGEPQSLTVARITPSLLATLAVKPLRGRNLLDSDTDDGARPVMLTDQAWRRAFGRSEELVNATVTLDGVACTVVGIASPAIESLLREDILRPFAPPEEGRGDRVLRVVGRLRNGATTEGTTLALSSQVNTLEGSYPENRGFDHGLAVTLQEAVTRDLRQPTLALGALAAFLFFVMVVNVVGLRLASGESRHRNMAIRKMLGASTRRLLLDGLGTAVVTALLASGVGIAVWQWLLSAARQWTPSALMVQQLRLRPSLIAAGVCAAFCITIAGEVLSVLRGVRRELGVGLVDCGRSQGGGPKRQGLRAVLGLMQTTVAVVFTVMAVTSAVDARRRATIDYGFDLSHLWAMDIKAMPGRDGAIAAQGQELQRVVDSVASSPGVLSAGSTNDLPFTREPGSLPLRVRDRTLSPGERTEIELVTPGYFETLQLPLRHGRTFTRADDRRGPLVVVVNRAFAQRHWPGEDPVGRSVAIASSPWFTVVGVVGDVRPVTDGTMTPPKMYLSALQGAGSGESTIVVRGRAGVTISGNDARARMLGISPFLAIGPLRPVSGRLARFERPRLFATTSLVALALVSTILALAGVYCLVWETVAARRREVAIRRALGATERRLVLSLYWRAASAILLGALAGYCLSFGAQRGYEAVLGSSGGISQTAAAAALLSVGIVLLAGAIAPAVRVAALPIMQSLRQE